MKSPIKALIGLLVVAAFAVIVILTKDMPKTDMSFSVGGGRVWESMDYIMTMGDEEKLVKAEITEKNEIHIVYQDSEEIELIVTVTDTAGETSAYRIWTYYDIENEFRTEIEEAEEVG